MWRSSESSDPRKRSLHRRVSLLRRSEVGNTSASGSVLDDDTDANWNEMEPQWWERLDRGPDKRASANYLPVNRSNTPNYSEILVQESRTIRISVVEDEHSDDSTFDSMGSLPTMSPMAFTKKKGLFQNNLKKKMEGGTAPKPLLALPAPEMPPAPPVQQNKTVTTDSDADSYLESLHFHSKIHVDPQGERNLRARNKNLFKNKKKNNHMTFSKAVDTSSKVENNSGSINENQSIPVLKKPNLSQKQSKKLFKKNSKPRNSLFADALSHLESDGSLKAEEDLKSNEVNKPADPESISKYQETLKRRTSGRVSFSQRRLSDAESVKSGYQEYSPSSVVSETINFDRWKQLASSTMLDADKSPKTMNKSNFKGSKQSLSDKLAMLHSDIVEEKMSPAAFEFQPNVEINIELPPALENSPKEDVILPEEVLVESQVRNFSKTSPATRRSDRLSKNSPVPRKSTPDTPQNTPDLMRNVVNQKYSEAYLEDAFGTSKINEMNKTEDPVLTHDEGVLILPKNGSQRQSIGTWLRLEESDEEISPPLSQSDVDRQVIEEMMAKRTNPPVRRSAHFSKQNIQDMSDSDGETNQTHESIKANIEGGDDCQFSIEKLNASTDKQLATDKHQFEEKSESRNKSVSILTENENVLETLPIIAQSSVKENEKSISHTKEQVENLQILDVAEKSELETSNGIITDIGSKLSKNQSLTTDNFNSSNVSLNRSRKLQNSSQQSVRDNHQSNSTGSENVPETLPIEQTEENKKSMSNSQEQFENLQLLETAEKSQEKKNIESDILDPETDKIPIITSLHGSPISSALQKNQSLTAENSDSSNISLNRSRKLQNSSQQSAKDNHPDFLQNKSVSHSTGNENVPAALRIDQSNVEENKSIINSQEHFENLQLLESAEKSQSKKNIESDILDPNTNKIPIITSLHGSPISSALQKNQTLTAENSDSSNISLNRSRKLQNSSQQSAKDNHPDFLQNKSVPHSTGNEALRIDQSNVEENKSIRNSLEQVENVQIVDVAEKGELNKIVETEGLESNTEIENITSPRGSPIRSKLPESQMPTTENVASSLNQLRKSLHSSQQSVKDNHSDFLENKSVPTLMENENVPENLPIDQSNVVENKSISVSQKQVNNVEKSELKIIVESEILVPSTSIISVITSPHGSPIRTESQKSQTMTIENPDSSNISVNRLRLKQNSPQKGVQDNNPDWLGERPLKTVAPETSLSSSTHTHYSGYPNISADTSRNTFNSTLRNASTKDIWKDSVEEQVTPLKTSDIGVPTQKKVPDIEDSDLSANNSADRSRKILNSLKRRATDIWQDSEEDQATLTPMKTMTSTINFEDNSSSLLTPGPSKSMHRASVPAKRKFTDEELKEFAEKVMSENAKQAKIVEERLANRFTFKPYLSIPKADPKQVKQNPKSKLLNVPRKPRVIKPKNIEEKISKKFYMKEEWITKKLYNFVDKKLKPKYGLKSLLRTEKFIKDLASVVNIVIKSKGGHHHYVNTLMREMARLQLVTTYFDFCCFIHEYLPFYFRIKSIAAEGRDAPEFTGKVFEPLLY